MAAYPGLHARFFGSQTPGNAAWPVNDLPSAGGPFVAPSSFGETASQTAADPWMAFPDWLPAQAQQSRDPFAAFLDTHPLSGAASRFDPMQVLGSNALRQAVMPFSYPNVFALQSPKASMPAPVSDSVEPAPFEDLQILHADALQRSAAPPAQPNQGVPVRLRNGENIPDLKSPTGYLMSPVADLGPVAAAGRQASETYRSLLSNPETAPSALLYLGASLYANFHQGGTFDYQRQGNWLTGYTQLPQFYPISNVNVGLFAQQAGLTLDETLSIAGWYARLFSKNAKPGWPYSLDPVTKGFIETGFNIGESGEFGQPPAP